MVLLCFFWVGDRDEVEFGGWEMTGYEIAHFLIPPFGILSMVYLTKLAKYNKKLVVLSVLVIVGYFISFGGCFVLPMLADYRNRHVTALMEFSPEKR